MEQPKLLQVMVMTPEKVLFRGVAESISSMNDTGSFDILLGHANFITLIKERLIVRLPNKQEYRTYLNDGVLRVIQGDVKIFLGLHIDAL
jgi:F0F1-type ATP synthase epsilon subunit